MSLAPRIVLRTPISSLARLEAFLEECLRDKVVLIAVIGTGCEAVEDLIDALVVGDGTDPDRFINTTSHPDEALDEVMEFVSSFCVEGCDTDSRIDHVRL